LDAAPKSVCEFRSQAVQFDGREYSRHDIDRTLFEKEVPPEDHEKVIADLRAGYYEAEKLSVPNDYTSQYGQQGASAELGSYEFDPAGELFVIWYVSNN
jgi:hypothetical protein